MKKPLFICLSLLCLQLCSAQGEIKTMFYNLLNFPSTQPDRVDHLKVILDEIQPDLFLVCELENEQGGEYLFEESLETPDGRYVMAPFIENQSTGNMIQQLAYYNKEKLILDNVATLQNDIIKTDLRDINRYSFVLNTADAATNPIYLEVFVTHLKAGNGSQNPNNAIRRALEVEAFTDYLNANSATFNNRYILFAGDLNLYTSSEVAYQDLLDTANVNSIDFIDPINRPGNWHNGSSFQDIHTQSTLQSNGHLIGDDGSGDGATGGLDDRFDFILISENLQNGTDLKYIPNSYLAFGNNGNCYNRSIDNVNCTGVYSQFVREQLFNFSDHLPVVMSLETNATLLSVDTIVADNGISFSQGNLATDQLTVKASPSNNLTQIAIYDVLGQKVGSYSNINKETIVLPIFHLSKGIYYLKAQSTIGFTTLKFIKN